MPRQCFVEIAVAFFEGGAVNQQVEKKLPIFPNDAPSSNPVSSAP